MAAARALAPQVGAVEVAAVALSGRSLVVRARSQEAQAEHAAAGQQLADLDVPSMQLVFEERAR